MTISWSEPANPLQTLEMVQNWLELRELMRKSVMMRLHGYSQNEGNKARLLCSFFIELFAVLILH